MRQGTIFILLTILLINCSITAEKEAVGQKYIFDYEQILTENQVDSLTALFKNHETETEIQIVVVTTPDYGKHTKNVEYAIEFGNTHKINGIVIVFSRAKREVFIATGYGVEYFLRDEIAKKIIDNFMLPKFRENDYFGGLYAGSKEVVDFMERPENRMN